MRSNEKNLFAVICVLLLLAPVVIYLNITGGHPEQDTNDGNRKIDSAVGDNGNMLLGNPTNAVALTDSSNNYLIDYRYYVESYNNSKGGPNWVSWHIDGTDFGQVKRKDNFRSDKNLPAGFYAAEASDYKNTGFDKGHNCPSADRTHSDTANASTFLMNNIIPQAPVNNQNVWEHLETYCRNEVKKGNEVFVIMGNYGSGGTGQKGYRSAIANGKINVPAHIWKVAVIIPDNQNDLARINEESRVIAIDTPNDKAVSNDWMDYVTTIDAIETRCKCDLLSALPVALQQKIESRVFKGGN